MGESQQQPQYDEFTQRLVQQYHEVAQLAGALAHEIKNPLSVIRMNVELLAEDLGAPTTPQQRRALQKLLVVQQQCQRLENLLDDFLKFARLRRLELCPGSLNDQLDQVLRMYEPYAQQTGVTISRFLDPDLPTVMLDEQTLQAALLNLVKNAVDAMPDGGTLTARTRLTRTGVALDLIDTGHGIDEATATHMFDAFFSTKDGGSGLGLPTARKIIEAHGGTIDVQSKTDCGTSFTLQFPTPARLQAHLAAGKGAADQVLDNPLPIPPRSAEQPVIPTVPTRLDS